MPKSCETVKVPVGKDLAVYNLCLIRATPLPDALPLCGVVAGAVAALPFTCARAVQIYTLPFGSTSLLRRRSPRPTLDARRGEAVSASLLLHRRAGTPPARATTSEAMDRLHYVLLVQSSLLSMLL